MEPEDHSALVEWMAAKGKCFALADGQRAPFGPRWAKLSVVDLGELWLPSGEIGACDPFVGLGEGAAWLTVPPGRYPVKVTIAEPTPGDRIVAYLTLLIHSDADEVRREERGAIAVDAGAVCFVDADAARRCVDADWEAIAQGPGGWIERLHDPASDGLDLPLPGVDGNIVLCRSGLGDGLFPLIIGFDADDRPVRAHIDLLVVGVFPDTRPAPPPAPRRPLLVLMLGLVPMFALLGTVIVTHAPVEIGVFGAVAWALLITAVAVRLGWAPW